MSLRGCLYDGYCARSEFYYSNRRKFFETLGDNFHQVKFSSIDHMLNLSIINLSVIYQKVKKKILGWNFVTVYNEMFISFSRRKKKFIFHWEWWVYTLPIFRMRIFFIMLELNRDLITSKRSSRNKNIRFFDS